ncbi:1454_t:CDS:2 [Acaulospora colombiana]|uniref:1454_t:CDS:1 n=1 Tax=Acaulospora colombiana TaxID=27376 RepID=A0ACA9P1E0_9GLOM|nr:1454_t:CDS:2 [Acaulospora colombiana]
MSNTTTSPTASVIILSPAAQVFVSQASLTIGPWIAGTFVDLFLQGILASQVAVYFSLQKKRNIKSNQGPNLTWLVIGVTILCLIKSLQNIVNTWELVVTNYSNPDVSLSLPESEWKHYTTSLLTAIIATIVQTFFVHRYWKLPRHWYICLVMMIGILLSIVAASLVIASLADLKPSVGPVPNRPPLNGPLSAVFWCKYSPSFPPATNFLTFHL